MGIAVEKLNDNNNSSLNGILEYNMKDTLKRWAKNQWLCILKQVSKL